MLNPPNTFQCDTELEGQNWNSAATKDCHYEPFAVLAEGSFTIIREDALFTFEVAVFISKWSHAFCRMTIESLKIKNFVCY